MHGDRASQKYENSTVLKMFLAENILLVDRKTSMKNEHKHTPMSPDKTWDK
jgi:hypothetical protein